MADDEYQSASTTTSSSTSDGFEGYVETSVDPGVWLLLITTAFCFSVMLVAVPLLVSYKKKNRPKTTSTIDIHEALHKTSPNASEDSQIQVTAASVARVDQETLRIVGLAGPFTIQALASSVCSNACLILVSKQIGTKAAAAYAIVQVLVGLTDGVLRGPISACTTVCAHAVGAGNSQLAGEYIQLAIVCYLIFNLPVLLFWGLPFQGMYKVVLHLEWGDEVTAGLAQDFTNIYLFSYIFDSISSSVWQLLEITNHAVVGTVCSMIWGASNVVIIGLLVLVKPAESPLTLQEVAMVYVGTALFFVLSTYALAFSRGWLQPFLHGLHGTFALQNVKAVRQLLVQAVPLSFGYLMSNAQWTILTFMASHLGPAEVAAWALLGSIWDVFYTTTAGIGDAAEIRVSHHLGENSPMMAQLSAYKSLLIGMLVATTTSIVYFCLQNQIPAWFTSDETLQAMLRELVPFVGVANLTMSFGMQCWSLIGSQGKYSLATWVSFVSSWGICMPMAAILTYGFRIDLQGLTAAATIGYVSTGACLSYLLLGTDWYKVAYKIQQHNNDESVGNFDGEGSNEKETLESILASVEAVPRKRRRAAGRRCTNIRLLTIPAGKKSGITIGKLDGKPGNYIVRISLWSCLRGSAHVGNAILRVSGQDATRLSAKELSKVLASTESDRIMAVIAPYVEDHDDENKHDMDCDEWQLRSSGAFWNDGVFGYLTAPDGRTATIKEASNGDGSGSFADEQDEASTSEGVLALGLKNLTKLIMARAHHQPTPVQEDGGSFELI